MLKHFTFNNEITIAYWDSGDGYPLVLLHGFGASKETWFDIAPLLTTRYRLIMVDLKGFGDSSKPPDRQYSIPDQAKIISSFIHSLGIHDLTLLGHSYGGSVALLTYVLLKENAQRARLKSLIIIDGPAYPQDLPFFVSTLRIPILNWIIQNLVPAQWRARYTLWRIFCDKTRVTNDRIKRYAQYFDIPGAHHAMVSAARQIVPADKEVLAARLAEWEIPTLLIWGDNDPVIPLWQAYRIANEIPDAHLVLISNCGHVPHEEKPDQVAQAIMNFVG